MSNSIPKVMAWSYTVSDTLEEKQSATKTTGVLRVMESSLQNIKNKLNR